MAIVFSRIFLDIILRFDTIFVVERDNDQTRNPTDTYS